MVVRASRRARLGRTSSGRRGDFSQHLEPASAAGRGGVGCSASSTEYAGPDPCWASIGRLKMNRRIRRILGTLAIVVPVVLVALAVPAEAAVTISRAEASGGRLRVEGQAAPSRPITIDGVQMTTSSSSGSFKIDRSGFTPPADCTVDVADGSGTAADVR